MARKTLTDRGVTALNPRAKLYEFPDPQMPGHYVRVWPSGKKSFSVLTRGLDGKQVRVTLGEHPITTIDEARDLAREAIKRIKAGEDRAGPQSFTAVAEQWFKRHVEAKGLRSATEIRRYLDKWILPAWAGREFVSIRRPDIVKLLDHVEDNAGPVAADTVLKRVSAICAWYATRHENYSTPIVRGMRRSNTKERSRERILADDEICKLWNAAEGTFGDLIKLLLLTGQRREKVASMKWSDVSVDGVWSVPNGSREKGAGGELKLPELAIDILKARPRFASNPFVFAGRGESHFSGYSKSKAALGVDLPQWGLHDLRCTARSLMSRAGVRPDIAERVLGHAIKGVEGIYDRHQYREEKAHALKALAALVHNILAPQSEKVTRLRG
jgi:integrase